MPRTAEQPEDQPRPEAGVESGLRRQVGERGVAQAGGQQVRRERNARDGVTPQPGAIVGPQPADGGNALAQPRRAGSGVAHVAGTRRCRTRAAASIDRMKNGYSGTLSRSATNAFTTVEGLPPSTVPRK